MSGLFHLLGGGGGGEVSSDSGSSNGVGKDFILDYGNTGNSYSGDVDYEEEEDEHEEEEQEEEEEEYAEEEEEEEEHIIMRIIANEEYFTNYVTMDFFFQFKERIIYCYDQISRYSPLYMEGDLEFTESQLQGLEYLMDPRRPLIPSPTQHQEKRQFPEIFYSRESEKICSKPVEGVKDTFLVMRSFDYVFSFIIERALLEKGSKRLPNFVWKERTFQREERMRLHQRNGCHSNKLVNEHLKCPSGWVLYTKGNGEFMKYCNSVQSRNKYIDYSHDERFLSVMPLSFYLVNFLCGPLPVPLGSEATLDDDYDFWVSVPIHYLDIWESGHGSVI